MEIVEIVAQQRRFRSICEYTFYISVDTVVEL